MHFDLTVNVGNLIAAGTLMCGFIAAHLQNLRRLDKIEARLDIVFRWWQNNIANRPIR